MGKFYEEDSDFFKAIKYFYKSFDATPVENRRAKAECYNDIGAILSSLGKEDDAAKLWKEALVYDPANTNAIYNLKQVENDGSNENKMEFLNEEFSEFSFYQIPRMTEIEKMTEDEKIEFYEDTEVNFEEPVQQFELPELGSEVSEHLLNVFPFLPEDGIIMIMLVLPALEYSGITEDKLNNFISQTETPDGRETLILKWAYEIGTKAYEFSKITGKKKRETAFKEIIGLLNQEFNENDSLTVLDSINNEDDEIF